MSRVDKGASMMGRRAVRTNRDRAQGANRNATAVRVSAQRPDATPEPWDEGQVAFAHDLAVLMNRGLIAAVSDGPEIRYAATGGGDVLR
jgi:hypothetical protein